MAKKKKIIIFTAVFLIAGLIIGFVCRYFFAPVNPEISTEITRTSKISLYILQEYGASITDLRSSRLEYEDFSLFDKALIWSLISRAKISDEELDFGGAPILQFTVPLPPSENGLKRELGIFFGRKSVNGYCAVNTAYSTNSYWGKDNYYKVFLPQSALDMISKRFYDKGRAVNYEKHKNDKTDDEKYSEAIEKIKNS